MRRLAGAVLVLALPALWLVTLAGRVAVTPPAWLATLVIVLPHLYLALAVAAVLLWPLVGRRVTLVVVIGVALSAAALWGWAWLPHRTEASGETLKVMTWNVGRLGEMETGAAARRRAEAERLECVAATLEEAAPDVLAVLEISGPRLRALSARAGLEC